MSWQTTDQTIEAELAYRRERLTAELSRARTRRDERRARKEGDRGRARGWSLRAALRPAVHRTGPTGWSTVGGR